jgi:FAD/FMN-containing dehydrogenase
MSVLRTFFRKPRAIFAVICLTLFGIFTARNTAEYAGAPERDKDCAFTYPSTADFAKPTTLIANLPKAPFQLAQSGGSINDASCLNRTAIYGIVNIASLEDVRNALQFARENNLKVTTAGQRHSMGGQAFVRDGLVLDMRGFNQIRIDREHKIAHVQSGATWMQLQTLVDPLGLAVQAMQSINIFTIGGTLSVNAHGIAHRPGPVASTVKSFRIMLHDGTVKNVSPNENSELYRFALGGYGLFGVILDADLQLVDNEMYEMKTKIMDYKDVPAFYSKNVAMNDDVGLIYGRLSVSPTSYLREVVLRAYNKTQFEGQMPPLAPDSHVRLERLIINLSKTGALGRWVRWTTEKYFEPRLHLCVPRNNAMTQREPCLVSRNREMFDSMAYLKNRLNDTDILQEYFIPPGQMDKFVDGLRDIVVRDRANLLNITIRVVHKDTVTALPYAKEDMFAFVLYFNQKLNRASSQTLQKTTTDLIDLAASLHGTYYLPYQLYYSPGQLRQSYPEVDEVFAAKRKYDPAELFSNTWYEKYGK